MVLSYDGYLLNSAERLVYSDNLRVKTKHLGELMKNSWTLQQTGRPVAGCRACRRPLRLQPETGGRDSRRPADLESPWRKPSNS